MESTTTFIEATGKIQGGGEQANQMNVGKPCTPTWSRLSLRMLTELVPDRQALEPREVRQAGDGIDDRTSEKVGKATNDNDKPHTPRVKHDRHADQKAPTPEDRDNNIRAAAMSFRRSRENVGSANPLVSASS